MAFSREMAELGKKLQTSGHEIILPRNCNNYAESKLQAENTNESVRNKIEHDLIRDYFQKIKNCDGVLIANFDKNGIKNYIGGNSFLEIGFAHALNKKVFLFNDIPDIGYQDEIIAMKPIILNGDLKKII